MADNVTVNITETPDLVTVNITECALTVSVDGVTITGDGSPSNPLVGVAGTGDMAKAVYDPTNINSSAFNMENMSEGATKKILTVAERTKLTNLSGVNTGDQDLSPYLTSATAATTYEPLKGTDDNYVTDAQLIVIGNTSGTNTGDQDLSGLVPDTRTLTINGVSYDLSSNRTWTVDALPTQTGNAGKYLQTDGTTATWQAVASGASLSGLTLATATNTIDNTTYTQTWQWNSLTSGNGLVLSSSSTGAASNTQTVFRVNQTGANASATQTTYCAYFSNTKTGSVSTNVGAVFTASGGTTNYTFQSLGSTASAYFNNSNSASNPTAIFSGSNSQNLRIVSSTGEGNYYNISRSDGDGMLKFSGTQSGFTGYDFLNEAGVFLLRLMASKAFMFAGITAAAASAITPGEGMIVRVTDTNGTFTSVGYWQYAGAIWKAL